MDALYSIYIQKKPCNHVTMSSARIMLTDESGVSRITHVIDDFKTKKLHLLIPK